MKRTQPCNYIFLDLEWANSRNRSISQIGTAVFSDFDNMEPAESINEFIDPKDNYDAMCRRVTGICSCKTECCPDFGEFWERDGASICSHIITGYNVISADLDALSKNTARYGFEPVDVWCLDVMQIVKDLEDDIVRDYGHLSSKSLSTLAPVMGLPEYKAHDAYDDAVCCAWLLRKLINEYGVEPENYIERYTLGEFFYLFTLYTDGTQSVKEAARIEGLFESVLAEGADSIEAWTRENIEKIFCRNQIYPAGTILGDIIDELRQSSSLPDETQLQNYIRMIESFLADNDNPENELLGLLEGIIADHRVSPNEVKALDHWLGTRNVDKKMTPYSSVISAIENYMEDGDEDRFYKCLALIVDPLDVEFEKELPCSVEGKHFCLSGTFSHGSKSEIMLMITEACGIIDNNVKKTTTDYLVLGALGDPSWTGTN